MAFGGSETGLLYEGPISLVYTLIAAIYCWIFAGVFNACNYAVVEILLRDFVPDERVRMSVSCLMMRFFASATTLLVMFYRWDYTTQLDGARVYVVMSSMVVGSYILEIGKKAERMGMTTLLHHGAQVLVTLYALEQMYGEIAHHMETSDMNKFFDLMFEEDFIREFKQPHQTNAKVMTYYASILLITAAFETPLYLGRMYGKLLKFFPPLAAEEKQLWFTNDEIVAFFNYFYWIMLKLIGVPFATIYLLAYYGSYSADIGGTIAVIVISATILVGCDIKVAMTFLKHYRRAAARQGRRSTIGDKEEIESTAVGSDNESFDIVTERFRGSLDLRNMSSAVRQIVQEEYKDERVWRRCKFRIFKTLAYSAMAIISLAFEFHLLNFSHDKDKGEP